MKKRLSLFLAIFATVTVLAVEGMFPLNELKNLDEAKLKSMGLDRELGMPIKGEGKPVLRSPGEKGWSGISLAWMSHGYEVSLTPLQTLAYYNAIANDGELVRPRLIKEVREWNRTVARFDKEVLNPAVCSPGTVKKVQQLLRNVVSSPQGTGHGLDPEAYALPGRFLRPGPWDAAQVPFPARCFPGKRTERPASQRVRPSRQ